MDGPAQLGAEHVVDQLVLLDPAEALEAVRDDLGTEVLAVTAYVHLGVRERSFDPLLQVLWGRHDHEDSEVGTHCYRFESMVTMTEIAADKVRGFLAQQETEGEVGLRIGVRGGGCSGFQYALALDEKRDEDQVFDHEGIRLIVDPASMRYVDGSQVDYTESLMGAGFEVKNPNVVASCGCGSSFRIADEDPSCGS